MGYGDASIQRRNLSAVPVRTPDCCRGSFPTVSTALKAGHLQPDLTVSQSAFVRALLENPHSLKIFMLLSLFYFTYLVLEIEP